MNEEGSSKPPKSKKEKINTKDGEKDLPARINGEPKADSEAEADFKRLVDSAPAPVRRMMLQMMSVQGRGPLPHPIFEKFTPEHVDKFLDYSHEDEVNEYSLARFNKWFHLGYAVLFAAFLVFLVVYLAPSNKDLLGDILKMLAVFAGGFGSGFGVKTVLGKKE